MSMFKIKVKQYRINTLKTITQHRQIDKNLLEKKSAKSLSTTDICNFIDNEGRMTSVITRDTESILQ